MAKILDLTIGLSVLMQGQPDAPFNKASQALQNLNSKIKNLTSTQKLAGDFQKLTQNIN